MRKTFLFVGAVIILIVSILAVLVLFSPPKGISDNQKEQALARLSGGKLNLTDKNAPTGDRRYKGKYASFMYPAAAKIYTQTVNGKKVADEGALEYFAFDLQDPSVNVVTEVIKAPASVLKLSDYPSVSLRQSQQDLYIQNSIKSADGVGGLSFKRNDSTGFEKTAFFYTRGRIYSFSVISVDIKREEEIFNKMISTLVFAN